MEMGFISWEMLATFTSFVTILFMFVEFTKELPLISKIKTKYYSGICAFVLLTVVNVHGGTFQAWDMVIYMLSAISISLTANGISDFNNPVDKTKKDKKDKVAKEVMVVEENK